MPHVSVRVAAALTGKDRSTILRAIKSGVLSASKTDLGRLLIDPAELERVYGTLRPAPVQGEELPEHAPDDSAALRRELALLREIIERERMHHDEVRGTYERDRRAWDEERTFLRGLLTDQRERATERQRSWLARLLRRSAPSPSAP